MGKSLAFVEKMMSVLREKVVICRETIIGIRKMNVFDVKTIRDLREMFCFCG
jgi:hypothetical protein